MRDKTGLLLLLSALLVLFFSAALLPQPASAVAAGGKVVIYENAACGHCKMYLMNLKSFLEEQGIYDVTEKDVINDLEARRELDSFNKNFGIPTQMQGHIVTVFDGGRLVVSGHVPIDMLSEFFPQREKFPPAVILQDLMVELSELESYWVMLRGGAPQEFKISVPFAEALAEAPKGSGQTTEKFMPWIILSTGILAGVHPCTISVLLFFLAFLFTIGRRRGDILAVGATYILGIFLADLLIGLGILKAVVLFNQPHFTAIAGAYLIILLGFLNVIGYFIPEVTGKLFSIPPSAKPFIEHLEHKATLPAAFVLGVIVGVCSFGCTAGIYFSILTLLSASGLSYLKGVAYLTLYNAAFVVPLIAILAAASNRRVVGAIGRLEYGEKELIKLAGGLIMIAIGLFIIYGGILH